MRSIVIIHHRERLHHDTITKRFCMPDFVNTEWSTDEKHENELREICKYISLLIYSLSSIKKKSFYMSYQIFLHKKKIFHFFETLISCLPCWDIKFHEIIDKVILSTSSWQNMAARSNHITSPPISDSRVFNSKSQVAFGHLRNERVERRSETERNGTRQSESYCGSAACVEIRTLLRSTRIDVHVPSPVQTMARILLARIALNASLPIMPSICQDHKCERREAGRSRARLAKLSANHRSR